MTTQSPLIIPPFMADAMMKQWGAIPDNCVVVSSIDRARAETLIKPMPRAWVLPDGRPPGFHRGASGTTPAPRIFRRSAVSRAARRALWGKP